MTRGRGLDYLPSETEALAELDSVAWRSFDSEPPDEDLWNADAVTALAKLQGHRKYQDLDRACEMLRLRGQVERRKFPDLGGGWFYRLLPVVTGVDTRVNP